MSLNTRRHFRETLRDIPINVQIKKQCLFTASICYVCCKYDSGNSELKNNDYVRDYYDMIKATSIDNFRTQPARNA